MQDRNRWDEIHVLQLRKGKARQIVEACETAGGGTPMREVLARQPVDLLRLAIR